MIEPLDRQILIQVVVDQRDRRRVARAEALQRQQRELAVLGRLVRLDIELVANVIEDRPVPANLAAD